MHHVENLVLMLAQERPSRGGQVAILLVFALAVVALLSFGGLPVIHKYGHDVPIILDGAWRMEQGQRPHMDFYTPLGELAYAPAALGLHLIGRTATVLPLAHTLTFLLVLATGFVLASGRLLPRVALAYCMVAGLASAGLHVLGFGITDIGYAMGYNRVGFALLGLLLPPLFLPSRDSGRWRVAGALAFGAVLSWLLFLKVSFFLVALVVAGGAALVRRAAYGQVGRACLSFLGTSAVILLVFRIDPVRMVGDLSMAAAVRKADASADFAKLLEVVTNEGGGYALLAVAVVSAIVASGPSIRPAYASLLLALLVVSVGASLVLTVSNWQWRESPVIPLAALVALDLGLRQVAGHRRVPDARGASEPATHWPETGAVLVLLLASAHLTAVSAFRNLGGIAWAAVEKRDPRAAAFQSEPLAALAIAPRGGGGVDEGRIYRSYVDKVNDGLALLRANVPGTARVACLDFSNPFSFALGLPSPRGTANWWHVNRNFSLDVHIDETRALGDADFVMVPRFEEGGSTDSLRIIYGRTLRERFRRVAETGFWTLLVRVGGEPGQPGGARRREDARPSEPRRPR